VRDRLRRRQPLRVGAGAVDEGGVDLGVAGEPAGEAARQHRQARVREHLPAHPLAQQLSVRLARPRAHEVARAEQLRADGVLEQDLARDHALEQKQADVLVVDGRQVVARPLAARQRDDLRADLDPGGGEPLRAEAESQVRVEIEQGDPARGHEGPGGRPPRRCEGV
jgi:hypothetical protein